MRAILGRQMRVAAGFLFLLVGFVLALPFVPGPGIAFMILGLVLLSDHFAWARRTLDWARQKWQKHRKP